MVAPEEGVPVNGVLPVVYDLFEAGQVEGNDVPFTALSVHFHNVKLEQQIHLLPALHEGLGDVRGHEAGLAHAHAVPSVKALPPHLAQVVVEPRLKRVMLRRKDVAPLSAARRQPRLLGQKGNGVHAESVHALVEPPVYHVVDLPPHAGILPVQIRLLIREEMQVPLAAPLVVVPRGGGEEGDPVVRLPPVPAVPPDVVVAVGIVLALARLREPPVLVGGVVHHQIHDELDVPLVHLPQQLVKVLHGAELRHDLLIVPNVVAHVGVGGVVYGAEPHGAHAQLLQIVQPADDAPQVADAVAVGVLKAAGIDLVKDPFLPPSAHSHPPYSIFFSVPLFSGIFLPAL